MQFFKQTFFVIDYCFPNNKCMHTPQNTDTK